MNDIVFYGLGLDAWITIATMIGVFATLLFTNTKAHTAFFCAIALPNRAPVDNGMVYIDNVADDTKIEIKCAGNLSGIASVKKGGRLIPLPCVVIHIPNVH